MFIRDLILTDKPAIQTLIKDSFSGFPWYMDYSQTELDDLWQSDSSAPGFSGIVAVNDNVIIGASWWHFPSLDKISGNSLISFVQETRSDRTLVWEDAILVSREYQKQGVGMLLRRAFIEKIRELSNRAMVLSRMRSDNVPSLLLAERLGFKKTGARSKERNSPVLFQEYWYLLV